LILIIVWCDHSLVLCNIKIRLQKLKHKPPKPRRKLALLQTNIAQQYRQQLDESLNSLEAVEDLDKRTDMLVAAINSSIEEVLPVEKRIRNKWISKETLEKVKQKRKLKLHRDQSESAEAEYRRKCNEVRKATRGDKQKWMEDKCNDIQKYHAEYITLEVYKLIKDLNKKWQAKTSATKDKNGKPIMEREKVKERWTEYCSELCEITDMPGKKSFLKELNEMTPPPSDNTDDSILWEEVTDAVRRLKLLRF